MALAYLLGREEDGNTTLREDTSTTSTWTSRSEKVEDADSSPCMETTVNLMMPL